MKHIVAEAKSEEDIVEEEDEEIDSESIRLLQLPKFIIFVDKIEDMPVLISGRVCKRD